MSDTLSALMEPATLLVRDKWGHGIFLMFWRIAGADLRYRFSCRMDAGIQRTEETLAYFLQLVRERNPLVN